MSELSSQCLASGMCIHKTGHHRSEVEDASLAHLLPPGSRRHLSSLNPDASHPEPSIAEGISGLDQSSSTATSKGKGRRGVPNILKFVFNSVNITSSLLFVRMKENNIFLLFKKN